MGWDVRSPRQGWSQLLASPSFIRLRAAGRFFPGVRRSVGIDFGTVGSDRPWWPRLRDLSNSCNCPTSSFATGWHGRIVTARVGTSPLSANTAPLPSLLVGTDELWRPRVGTSPLPANATPIPSLLVVTDELWRPRVGTSPLPAVLRRHTWLNLNWAELKHLPPGTINNPKWPRLRDLSPSCQYLSQNGHQFTSKLTILLLLI